MKDKSKMEREREIKFDVPLTLDESLVLSKLAGVLTKRGYDLTNQKTIRRNFLYYDTPDYNLYKEGRTIRRVGGFDPRKHQGSYRYDIKTGPINDRYEAQIWTDKEIPVKEAMTRFGATNLPNLIQTVSATTKHITSIASNGENQLKISLDQFTVENGGNFSELELELERGNELELDYLANRIEKKLGLQQSHKQKYARALEATYTFQALVKRGRN